MDEKHHRAENFSGRPKLSGEENYRANKIIGRTELSGKLNYQALKIIKQNNYQLEKIIRQVASGRWHVAYWLG